jgi:dTDP-4-amino-4,6-dideoxygalactose transaminase
MKMLRTIPPAAPAVRYRNLLTGLAGFLYGNRYLEEAKNDLMDFFGVRHVFLLNSGTAALFHILRSLKAIAPNRDEVVIPAYTCYTVPSAVASAGLRIIPCDISERTFGFDHDRLEEVVGERTLCVVPTHLFGIPENLERVIEICRRRKAFSIEDAAQAMGGIHNGRKLGTACDVGFFSLGRGKNITCGGGGIILTDSDSIAHEMEREYAFLALPNIFQNLLEYMKMLLMCVFITPRLYWVPASLPFLRLGESVFSTTFPVRRLSGVNAGMLKGWRDQLERGNRIREKNGDYYRRHLGQEEEHLPPVPYLRFPYIATNGSHRERLLQAGEDKGLGFSAMYPSPIHEIEEIRAQFANGKYPRAKKVSQRIVTLPTHGFLSGGDLQEILTSIEESRTVA